MKLIRAVAIFAVAALASGTAISQSFPNKPVRFVVAYPPGGATDITARILGRALDKRWGNR